MFFDKDRQIRELTEALNKQTSLLQMATEQLKRNMEHIVVQARKEVRLGDILKRDGAILHHPDSTPDVVSVIAGQLTVLGDALESGAADQLELATKFGILGE